MWDVFMDQFEVLATQAPVMLVAGNHERDFPDSGDRYGTNIDSGKHSWCNRTCHYAQANERILFRMNGCCLNR